jgi:hypothetical protein
MTNIEELLEYFDRLALEYADVDPVIYYEKRTYTPEEILTWLDELELEEENAE